MGLAVRWMCVKIHMCNLGGRLRSSPTPCYLFIYLFWPRHRTCEILVLQPGTEPRPMAVRAPSPYYWTAREFPLPFFFKAKYICLAGLGVSCIMQDQFWHMKSCFLNGA